MLSPARERTAAGPGGGTCGGIATGPAELLDEPDNLKQALDIEEVVGQGRRVVQTRRAGVVGPTHGDGGVAAVRESDDQIWIVPSADADDLDPLTAQRVTGMGDGYGFRRSLD